MRNILIVATLSIALQSPAAKLSISSTNDYVLISGVHSNGLCGVGIGHATGTGASPIRYEDFVFLQEAIRERSVFDQIHQIHTNKVNSEITPWDFEDAGVLTKTYDLINGGSIYTEEHMRLLETAIIEDFDPVVRRGFVSNLLFPTNTSAWLGYNEFSFYLNQEDKSTNSSIPFVSFRFPLMSNMVHLVYGNLSKMDYAVTEKHMPTLTNDVVQVGVIHNRGYRFTIDWSDDDPRWLELPADSDTTNSYTRSDYGSVNYYDRYSFTKTTWIGEFLGLEDKKSYIENYYTFGAKIPAVIKLDLIPGQQIIDVMSFHLIVDVILRRYVNDYDGEHTDTNLIDKTYRIPVTPSSFARSGEIAFDIDLDDICENLMMLNGRQKPSSNGPELFDLISYPKHPQQTMTGITSLSSSVYESLQITPKELIGVVKVKWHARELEN